MENIKSVIKSRAFMYFLLAMLSLLLACLCNEYDYDLFARLIVGEHFFANGSISYQDFMSYTPTHIWFDHEYGASLVFYLFFKYLGHFGLVLNQAVLLFLTTFFIIKTQDLHKNNYPPTLWFSGAFLLVFAHLNPSLIRCHMFSFMFFSLLLYILERTRIYNSKIVYTLPLLIILWNNTHGGVVAGLGIIFIYMIGELLRRKPWKKYLVVLLISTPLLAINPWGWDYFYFLISANTKNRMYVTEWWYVFALRHVQYYYPAFIISLFTVVTAGYKAICKKKFDITKLLVLIVTAALGTMHVKLLSLSVITVAALYYKDIMALIANNGIRFLEKTAYALCALSILFIPFTHPYKTLTNMTKFPIAECEFLKINNMDGNIATEFALGSYTAYKLYPNNLIFMDGRYEECYYDREFDTFINFVSGEDRWDDIIMNYPTEILMPDKSTKIYNVLKANPFWTEIFDGPLCGIFIPTQFAQKEYKQPSQDLKYYEKILFKTNGEFGKKDEERLINE
ncbi:MAG: hypothetical protein NC408_04000 [Candidatus Gastranaerophilales bacterium]|nr:hypothetical protein [Candidatus Gastranaerophilales bacterium]